MLAWKTLSRSCMCLHCGNIDMIAQPTCLEQGDDHSCKCLNCGNLGMQVQQSCVKESWDLCSSGTKFYVCIGVCNVKRLLGSWLPCVMEGSTPSFLSQTATLQTHAAMLNILVSRKFSPSQKCQYAANKEHSLYKPKVHTLIKFLDLGFSLCCSEDATKGGEPQEYTKLVSNVQHIM